MNKIGCKPPEFINPFWAGAGVNFPSIIGNQFNYRRGNPTWQNGRLYLNDNGHGTTNDEIDSTGTWNGVASDKTFILLAKQIGVGSPSSNGSNLFRNYSGTLARRISIAIDGSVNQHKFTLGNDDGHRHEGLSGVDITYGKSYLTAMRGNYADNTVRSTVNGTHINLTQLSNGWATGSNYSNDFLFGAYLATSYPYYGADAEYDMFMYIPDYLTDDQMGIIYEDPYASFQRPVFRTYFDMNSDAGFVLSGAIDQSGGVSMRKSYHRGLTGVL